MAILKKTSLLINVLDEISVAVSVLGLYQTRHQFRGDSLSLQLQAVSVKVLYFCQAPRLASTAEGSCGHYTSLSEGSGLGAGLVTSLG